MKVSLLIFTPHRFVGIILFLFWCFSAAADKPNIVVVYADDLGYGDVHCYDPDHCKVATPFIDQLAGQGMRFTDASNSASLCTPSRYSLLTGRYSWRSRLKSHVLRDYGSPLIEPERLTMPAMLKSSGYRTVCLGKWHLGWNWPMVGKEGKVEYAPDDVFLQERKGKVDFSLPTRGGPVERGFDEYFGIGTPNQIPYAWIRNDRLTARPTALKGPSTRIRWGKNGPMDPDYDFEQVMPRLVDEAEAVIARCAKGNDPFFLYFALTTPHEPIAPSEAFKGKSGISDVADLIMETDAALGRVMASLESHGLADNTILIFSSDNGHASYTTIKPFVDAGHRISGPFRGYKGFVQEGGMRVPLIVRWPKKVRAGTVCTALANTTDLMATFAEVCGFDLPPDAAEDSVSLLPLLTGKAELVRQDMIVHSYMADVLAIRKGPWKLAFAYGSGGQANLRIREKGVDPVALPEPEAKQKKLPPIQLYNLETDPEERSNICDRYPEVVDELILRVREQIRRGRSTPGPGRKNDREISVEGI